MLTCNSPPLSTSAVPRGVLSGASGSILLTISSMQQVAVLPLVSQVAEVFLPSLCPRLPVPGTLSPSEGHSGGFVPLGQFFHSGGVSSPRQLDSPSHSLAIPPGVSRYSGGLRPPLSSSHSGGLADGVYLPDGDPLTFPFSRPMSAPPLLLRLRPWMLRPRWRLCRPLQPLDRFPRRFLPVPLLLL